MPFWSSETFEARGNEVISGFSPENVKHGAYELAIGPEIYLTSSNDGEDPTKQLLKADETFVIPVGQFALLLTEESITIPNKNIGFISMRFSVKKRGLINVSGFHVDPGYSNRLKFSVYNAGPSAVTLHRGKRIFMLWLGEFDTTTKKPYKGKSSSHDTITTEDQDIMRGRVSSPSQLRKELDELTSKQSQDVVALRHEIDGSIKYKVLWIGLLSALLVRALFLPWEMFSYVRKPSQTELKEIEQKVTEAVTARLNSLPPDNSSKSSSDSTSATETKSPSDSKASATNGATADPPSAKAQSPQSTAREPSLSTPIDEKRPQPSAKTEPAPTAAPPGTDRN